MIKGGLMLALYSLVRDCFRETVATNERTHLANLKEEKLHALVADGDATELELFIKENKKTLNINCGVGEDTALIIAARLGHVESISVLVSNGADINLTNERGLTPLTVAICAKKIESVKRLCMFNSDMSYRSLINETPLHYAITAGDISIFDLVLNASNNRVLESKSYFGPTVLDSALCLEPSDYKIYVINKVMTEIMFQMLLKIRAFNKGFKDIPLDILGVLLPYFVTNEYSSFANSKLIEKAWNKTFIYYKSMNLNKKTVSNDIKLTI